MRTATPALGTYNGRLQNSSHLSGAFFALSRTYPQSNRHATKNKTSKHDESRPRRWKSLLNQHGFPQSFAALSIQFTAFGTKPSPLTVEARRDTNLPHDGLNPAHVPLLVHIRSLLLLHSHTGRQRHTERHKDRRETRTCSAWVRAGQCLWCAREWRGGGGAGAPWTFSKVNGTDWGAGRVSKYRKSARKYQETLWS